VTSKGSFQLKPFCGSRRAPPSLANPEGEVGCRASPRPRRGVAGAAGVEDRGCPSTRWRGQQRDGCVHGGEVCALTLLSYKFLPKWVGWGLFKGHRQSVQTLLFQWDASTSTPAAEATRSGVFASSHRMCLSGHRKTSLHFLGHSMNTFSKK